MAISIGSDKAVRELEEAARRARDQSYEVSDLWLDRVGELEAWKGNKLALTAFATAVLAKSVEPKIDPLSLIDRSGDPNSYNARMLARDVLVPSARRLGFLLGTDGPDPLAGSPWFGPERIDEIAKWRPKSKKSADNLVGWLAGLTHEDAKAALIAFVLRRSEVLQQRVEDRKKALVTSDAVVPLLELSDALDRFLDRNPEEGRRGAAAAAAAFSAAGKSVVARPVNDPGQVDIDVMDRASLLLIGIEVKQRPATAQDALDIAAGSHARGATRAILCAFSQKALRLSEDQLVAEADVEFGVFLQIVYSTGDLIRLAVLTSELSRPQILGGFPRAFSEHLEALGGSEDGLNQWKSLTEHWARQH
jgi:hypothetical protein